MELATLTKIVDDIAGITKNGSDYEVEEGHRVSLYIGEPGQSMVVSEIARLHLDKAVMWVETREDQTRLYVEVSSVHGVSVRPPKGDSTTRRAGFA